ncbi:subtilisin-like proprotein convertase family protein/Ca2+-binding RTX toxin-like protein [Pseudomonas sp. TE6283]
MINMTAEQLSELTRLRDSKRYPDMYRYMLEVVTAQKNITHDAQALDDLTTAQTWLNVAISVNSNDGQFPNQMVRGSMQFAAASKGKPLSDTEFQKGSDKLAWNIADSIIKNGGFPPINDIMKDDRDMTVDAFGLESWQWPGTIADTFPPLLGGLNREVSTIPGQGETYAKHLRLAVMQNLAGVSRYISSFTELDMLPAWKYANELRRFAADNTYKMFQWFGAGDDTPVQPDTNQSIQIHIDASPKPQQHIQGEDQARQDVSNGYVQNAATHNVFALGGILNKTDFASTQMASLTSGGIRPGEMQLDPNARPNSHLSKFYLDQPSTSGFDFSLRNAVTLNGLSAMTTRNTYVDPLLLDLGGEGVRMTDLSDAVLFDTDHSGTLKRSAWADRKTGMLVIDDGSGQVKDVSQMFSEYYKGKAGVNGAAGEARFKDGFAALASEDGNGDGIIDARDPIWNQLRVWVDASHDARVDRGELKTLTELGITQINVRAAGTPGESRDGSRVLARGSFVIGGNTREALAVDFLGDPVSSSTTRQSNGLRVTSSSDGATTTAYSSTSTQGEHLDATALGVNNLYGGSGDDRLTASASGSWLVGGGGSNTYVGGAGDDVFVISASDNPQNIQGNGGRDTALIVGDQGVELNMAKAGLTIAQGGRGDDVIRSGGGAGVFIKGGEGNATLIGGAGNDVLVGGSGHNTLIGGSGKAVIYAGPNGDLIYASAGGSIIHAGGGNDVIHGGAGDDVIEVGHGNARIDGGAGTNLVSLHGKYGEYRITHTSNGYQVADNLAGRDGTVQLRNIHKLNFADISAVDLSQPNAMPVADVLRQDKDGQRFDRNRSHLIAASSLLANDLLLGSQGGLRIDNIGDATGGSVSLTAQGDVLFTPLAGYTGMMGFKYGIVDAQGNKSASVVDLGSGQTAPMRASVTLLDAGMPNDPLAAQQWYLSDTNVLPVWQDYTGKGVRIAMFEPGGEFATAPEIFDIQHPDLAANVDQAWLKTQHDKGVLPELASNHATMVAGVMVAGRNDKGGVGVAYDAKLSGFYLANKGDDLTGLGNMVSYDVANHSWGFQNDFAISNLQNGAIDTASALAANARYAAHNGRGGLGTVIVTAGGNQRAHGGSAQGSLTNNNRFSIEVGAINAQGDLSTLQIGSTPFSNPGASLLVSAPGSNVLSTSRLVETERGSTFGNDYTSMQGTSFAAPIVSGVAALMLEANPNLGYRDVQQILALSARRVNDSATRWDDNGARNWNGGGMHTSHDYGFGEVDARAAVRLAESWMTRSTGADESVFSANSGALGKTLAGGGSLSTSLQMDAGLNVEHVEIDLDASVGRLGDLTVTLVSPDGTRSILLDRTGKVPQGMAGASDADMGSTRSGAFKYSFMSTRDWGERSAGTWTLEVKDASNGQPVTLNNWALRLYGSKAGADDTYFYTDEYLKAVQGHASRSVLDDAGNGTAGGRNTLNAAAVSGDVQVNLATGVASIGGAALTLRNPNGVHNLISGDGNDTLVAGNADALLDGGRGNNSLTGGSGKDFFVVHRREGGQDTVHHFEAAKGEVIDLVGFTGKTFADLTLQQQGADVRVDLGNGQHILLSGQSLGNISAANFQFQDSFVAPANYVDSSRPNVDTGTVAGTMVLNGGGQGVNFSSGADGQLVAALAGKVYSHDSATSDRFIISHQLNASDYHNALRGFRHGIDKIDLSQVGVTRFEELSIVQKNRGTINGLSQIHGVELSTNVLRGANQPVNLAYLDAIEVAQLDAGDFIFASAHLPMETGQPALPPTRLPGTDLSLPDRVKPIEIPDRLTPIVERPDIKIPDVRIPDFSIPDHRIPDLTDLLNRSTDDWRKRFDDHPSVPTRPVEIPDIRPTPIEIPEIRIPDRTAVDLRPSTDIGSILEEARRRHEQIMEESNRRTDELLKPTRPVEIPDIRPATIEIADRPAVDLHTSTDVDSIVEEARRRHKQIMEEVHNDRFEHKPVTLPDINASDYLKHPTSSDATPASKPQASTSPAQAYQLIVAGQAWSAGSLSGLFGMALKDQAPVYQVSLADGSPLPAWMSFDSAQASLAGIPEAGLAGTFDIKVNAGSQTSAVLHLMVQPTVMTVPMFSSVTLADDQYAVNLSNSFTKVTANGGRHLALLGSGAKATLLGRDDQQVFATGSRAEVTLGDGNNTVKGGVGTLVAGHGDNLIETTGSSTNLTLGNGHNTIKGSLDKLVAGNGDNLIETTGSSADVTLGDGRNTINGRLDKLVAGNGDNHVESSGSFAEITLGNGGNSIKGEFRKLVVGDGDNRIETSSSFTKIKLGKGHNNVVVEGSMADVEVGEGHTEVAFRGSMSTLNFGKPVLPEQLWFQHQGDDLLISRIGSAQQVTLHDWYASSPARVRDIVAGNGQHLSDRNVEQLVQAMAAFAPPGAAATSFDAAQAQALQPVLAANWR